MTLGGVERLGAGGIAGVAGERDDRWVVVVVMAHSFDTAQLLLPQ